MSFLDDVPLKPDIQEWLAGPLNLLHTIFVEVLPGIVFVGLLWVGGNGYISRAISNDTFGYRTKLVLLLGACYVVGKLLPTPWLVLAGFFRVIGSAINKKKQPSSPEPPSSGFDKWYASQNPHVRKIINSLAIAPLYLGKRSFSHLITIAHAETAFYIALGNAFVIAAAIQAASPFRRWEVVLGILGWVAGLYRHSEYQDLTATMTILATTDALVQMSPEERSAVFNAAKKFALVFSPVVTGQVISPQQSEASGENKSQGAGAS